MSTLFLSPENRTVAVARLAEDMTISDGAREAYANEFAGGEPAPSSRPVTDAVIATVFYTIAEAAKILNVAQSTIRRRIKKGDYTMQVGDDGVQRVTLPA